MPGQNDTAMDTIEQRGFVVCGHSEIREECCIWAFHERLLESFVLKPSTWRSQLGIPLSYAELKEYVGARARSTDVHLPLSLAVRPKGKNNYRKRSQQANAARQEKKAARGYTQWPASSSSSRDPGHGSSSSSSAWPYWSSWWGSWSWDSWGSWNSWEG